MFNNNLISIIPPTINYIFVIVFSNDGAELLPLIHIFIKNIVLPLTKDVVGYYLITFICYKNCRS